MVWVWFLPCFRLYSWAMCLLCYSLPIIRFSFVLYMFLWFDISFAIELEGLVVKQSADRSHWSLYCPLRLRSFSPQPLALFTKWIMFPVRLNSKSGLTCRKSWLGREPFSGSVCLGCGFRTCRYIIWKMEEVKTWWCLHVCSPLFVSFIQHWGDTLT